MRRSEMIKKIHDRLVGTSTLELTDSPNFAEHLLDFIEGLGMNPPYDSTSDDDDPNYCWEPEEYKGSKYDPEGEWGE